jgi:cell division protein FtsL
MSKSSKPILFLTFLLLIMITVFALVSVGIKLKYEQAVLQKDAVEKQLKSETQRKIKLTAEYQTATAEERIFNIASTELGLIRDIEAPVIITYNSKKVELIEEELKRKYE